MRERGQVGAGLRSRLAPDDSLHTRGLATLIEARLADNPRFLSIPKLRDQDDRGFCLLHHAAAFGNASKVLYLVDTVWRAHLSVGDGTKADPPGEKELCTSNPADFASRLFFLLPVGRLLFANVSKAFLQVTIFLLYSVCVPNAFGDMRFICAN